MPVDLSVGDLVRQLRKVGLRPSERLVQHILEQESFAVTPLLELATNTPLLHEEEPTCYGPLHALRLLGEVRPLEMIVPLLSQLPVARLSPEDRATMLWAQEVPQIVGRIGEPAVAPLQSLAKDESYPPVARGAAIHALAYAATIAPETREAIVAWLREYLATADNPVLTAYLVVSLSQLGESAAYQEIMAAYREGRVERELISAAQARQMLLGKIEKRLACVAHPIWERYDEHGPFTKEEYEMAERYADAYDDDYYGE